MVHNHSVGHFNGTKFGHSLRSQSVYVRLLAIRATMGNKHVQFEET